MRLYEAALTGSIPVIWSESNDMTFRPGSPEIWLERIGYLYMKAPSLAPGTVLPYNQTIVDINVHKFIKYQTFIEGDNTPPINIV